MTNFTKKAVLILLFLLSVILMMESMILADESGYVSLIRKQKNKKTKQIKYNKHGWNHYGPGYFILDEKEGTIQTKKGMGLFWHGKKYKNFILEFDFKVDQAKANSGVFIRVPDVPIDNSYIKKTFEVQICDIGKEDNKITGALYSAKAPDKKPSTKKIGEWNHYKISCKGKNIQIELNGDMINNWDMEPAGKVTEFALEGYIGFQNHDTDTITVFKDIKIKELD